MPDPITTDQFLFIFFLRQPHLYAMCETAPASAVKPIEPIHALGAIQ